PRFLRDLEAEELERVVLVLLGRGQGVTLDFECDASFHGPVELDHRPAGRATMRDDLDTLAAREKGRAGLPPPVVVGWLLHEERPVDPRRTADTADPHPHRRDSRAAIDCSRSAAASRFSAMNSSAVGHRLARISRTARSTSIGVRMGRGSPSSTSVQNAATSLSYGIPIEPALTTRRPATAPSTPSRLSPITN